MTTAKHEQHCCSDVRFPVAMIALTMALFFIFQMMQVMKDRTALAQTIQQLEAPFADSKKVNDQFGGLVVGTRQLAEEGNVAAKDMVKKLKQIGILPEQDAPANSKAPVPAANEKAEPSPVKP